MKPALPPQTSNVIRFPSSERPSLRVCPDSASPWHALTHALVMDRARKGTLDPAVVEALLIGVGVEP
jgi:hypothetical protein